MKALLIIDMQNDFMPDNPLGVADADKIIDKINGLMDLFDEVYATKDWHPEEHISFASTHHKKVGDTIEVDGKKERLWPKHCVQNTLGADFVKGLRENKIRRVFYKGADKNLDSYSAFFDNQHKKSNHVDEYFKSKGIHSIYLTGVATDYCVKFTALDGIKLGYHVYLIKDACKSVHPENEKNILEELEKQGVCIITSTDIS